MSNKNQQDRKKSIIKLLIFAAVLAGIITAVKMSGVDQYLDKDKLQGWIKGLGPWGPVLYILIYSITPALFLPGLPLTVAGGLAFGPLYGTIFTIIGATIGASIAFIIARYFAREHVERLVSGKLKTIDDGVEEKGWIYVAITRLIPLFPFNLLNYAFGLTKIKFSHYVLASFVFMLPGTAAYVILSSSLLDILKGKISTEFIVGFMLVLIVSLVPLIYRKVKSKKEI